MKIASKATPTSAKTASHIVARPKIPRAINKPLAAIAGIPPELESSLAESMTLADIAKSLTEAGQYEQALQIARTIEDNFAKANTLVTIASKYASTGQTNKAKEICISSC